MRVLLTSFGTRGDVQPFVALGRGLRDAGHDVTFCGAPDYAAWLEREGIAFAGAGEAFETLLPRLDDSPPKVFAALKGQVADQFAVMDELVAGADVVLSGSLEFATASLAEQHGTPRRAVMFSPCMLPAPANPMPLMAGKGVPRWLFPLTWWLSDLGVGASLMRPVVAERKRRGLRARVGRATAFFLGDEVWIPFPASLATVDEPRPPVRAFGPWLLDDEDASLPEDVAAFLDAGPPPAYLGTGSMPSPDDFARLAADAARAAGLRAVIAGADGPSGSDDVLHLDGPVPHPLLFPRCACVVHHGGAGTTITALRAAAPQVVLPYVADQHFHARVLHEQGLGAAPVRRRGLNAKKLAAALREAVEGADRDALARHAAAVTSGVPEAVAAIEALGARERPPREVVSHR